MANKIQIEGDVKLVDQELRDWVSQINTKVETINDRTKDHTIRLRQLEKEVKTNGKLKRNSKGLST